MHTIFWLGSFMKLGLCTKNISSYELKIFAASFCMDPYRACILDLASENFNFDFLQNINNELTQLKEKNNQMQFEVIKEQNLRLLAEKSAEKMVSQLSHRQWDKYISLVIYSLKWRIFLEWRHSSKF